jgi:hypothetical protein
MVIHVPRYSSTSEYGSNDRDQTHGPDRRNPSVTQLRRRLSHTSLFRQLWLAKKATVRQHATTQMPMAQGGPASSGPVGGDDGLGQPRKRTAATTCYGRMSRPLAKCRMGVGQISGIKFTCGGCPLCDVHSSPTFLLLAIPSSQPGSEPGHSEHLQPAHRLCLSSSAISIHSHTPSWPQELGWIGSLAQGYSSAAGRDQMHRFGLLELTRNRSQGAEP